MCGMFEDALNDFNTAINLNPKDIEAFIWRCETHHNLGNEDAAFEDITQAVQLDPQNESAKKILNGEHWELIEDETTE